MLFDDVIIANDLDDFTEIELDLFHSLNDKIYNYIVEVYDIKAGELNAFEEIHVIFILNIIRGIICNYEYQYDISKENLKSHYSFYYLYFMIYANIWKKNITLNEIFIATIFSFYSFILLDFYGTCPSVEEICMFTFKIEKDSESYIKIQNLFYGIAISDQPFFSEIRGRILMPHLYDNMIFEYKI